MIKKKIDDKMVVFIEIEESKQKPVLASGRAYKRVGKSNHKLGYEEIRNLKEARHKRGLDINEDRPVGDALLRLKLLKDGKPTNGAVLLFGEDPQRRFIQSEVKCIRFKGVSVTGEMVYLRTVDGSVFDQLIGGCQSQSLNLPERI